ncbi:MAG TPA: monovalent cation/H+ antiporter subunit D family protein [Burkholderiales bacterium]|nr:monovalent cation/H+ antiporter subunit D family protein [Burkholderiales bacterium]
MIAENLPALQVVVPLLAAPLMVLLRRGSFAWLLATLVSWTAFAIALALAFKVREAGPISYAMGSWPPPWGIEYRVDALNSFVLVLITFVASVVAPYARASVAAELPRDQHYLFFTMFSLCLAGLLGITITGDAFNLFVFLEISSLSTYVLVALGRNRRALLAAYQYLVLGTIGATFYIIGVGMLYLMTGTLNLADLALRLHEVHEMRPILAALAFITVGLGLKIALFPLHFWLPNAYAYAPSAISSFIAASATKVSVYVLLRFYFLVFGMPLVFGRLPMAQILIALSVLAVVSASLVAVFQRDLKRMFAYSSVAQIGYITLGAGLANEAGLTGAVVHLFNHGITKGAIFMLLGGVSLRLGSTSLERVAGLGKTMPLTSFGIVLGGMSLIGIPGTAGFISKWYLVLGAIEHGYWWLAALIVASSLIALVYVWRFVEMAYFRAPEPGTAALGEAPTSMLVPAWIMVAGCIYFGLDTGYTVDGAHRAAQVLLGLVR